MRILRILSRKDPSLTAHGEDENDLELISVILSVASGDYRLAVSDFKLEMKQCNQTLQYTHSL